MREKRGLRDMRTSKKRKDNDRAVVSQQLRVIMDPLILKRRLLDHVTFVRLDQFIGRVKQGSSYLKLDEREQNSGTAVVYVHVWLSYSDGIR